MRKLDIAHLWLLSSTNMIAFRFSQPLQWTYVTFTERKWGTGTKLKRVQMRLEIVLTSLKVVQTRLRFFLFPFSSGHIFKRTPSKDSMRVLAFYFHSTVNARDFLNSNVDLCRAQKRCKLDTRSDVILTLPSQTKPTPINHTAGM